MTPKIHTFSRQWVNPLDVLAGDLRIEDIAHALALINRFVGHTREPISVAQHCLWVSHLCGTHALQGLIHDAPEAYVGDVSKWLKHSDEMTPFRVIEDRIQRTIYRHFGCADETHAQVEAADKLMVRFEGMKGYGHDWLVNHPAYPPLTPGEIERIQGATGQTWAFWNWRYAEQKFMERFHQVKLTSKVAR